jgi:hypothetical protein
MTDTRFGDSEFLHLQEQSRHEDQHPPCEIHGPNGQYHSTLKGLSFADTVRDVISKEYNAVCLLGNFGETVYTSSLNKELRGDWTIEDDEGNQKTIPVKFDPLFS